MLFSFRGAKLCYLNFPNKWLLLIMVKIDLLVIFFDEKFLKTAEKSNKYKIDLSKITQIGTKALKLYLRCT